MIPHSRPTLGVEEKEAVLAVLESGQIAQGKKVMEFEKAFCGLTARRYAVAVSSGSAALHLSFLALGISEGDEVIVPSYTCVALLHAIDSVGASPAIADIDLEDFNLSISEVKKKIRRKTKAIVVPHAFGLPAQVDQLQQLGVPLIEDATQALGARANGKPVGSFGIISLFSFYATKMMTTGEGGMVLTDFPRLAEKLHDLRDYDKKETHRFRTNSKMTDLEAAMGLAQIKKLPQFLKRRRELASQFKVALGGSGVLSPAQAIGRDHIFYRYVVRVPKRKKEFMRQLLSQGIEVKEPVFKPLHQYLNLADSKFPFTRQAMKESCSLPIYPSLADDACNQICQAIRTGWPSLPSEEVKVLT